MDPIDSLVSQLKSAWSSAFEKGRAAPQLWKPHLGNAELEIVDEAVNSLINWLSRVRAPAGFGPGFHLAKSVAAISLPPLVQIVRQIESGQYNHLPTFVSSLVNLLNAVHTMAIFSQKDELQTSAAELGAELSQALALTNTAQRELAEKTALLTAALQVTQRLEKVEAECQELQAKTTEAADATEESRQAAKEASEEVVVNAEEIKKLRADAANIAKENSAASAELRALLDHVKTLQEKSAAQQTVIDSILPKGASAGLAAAFASRGTQLEWTKWGWVLVFVSVVGLLAAFAWNLSQSQTLPEGMSWTEYLVFRALLSAPLVWLGWFSAIQYGNIVRVQEDYAFKEATSKAFQGYRDHMEHLAKVDDDETSTTALNLLAQRTIEILAKEPLRIYGKTDTDASPASGLLSMWKTKEKPETAG